MDSVHSQIIERMKASGVFDQFRKECIADVDTKPAYINLHSRVVKSVNDYLKNIPWSSKLLRISVRDGMRKQIVDSSYFEKGVDRIVNQAVDPKVNTAFFPIVENAVYEFLGLQKPKEGEVQEEFEEDKQCWDQPMDIDPQDYPDGEVKDEKPFVTNNNNDTIDVCTSQPVVPEDDPMVMKAEIKEEEETNISDENDLIIAEEPMVTEDAEEDEEEEEESPPFEAIGVSSPPHPLPGVSTSPPQMLSRLEENPTLTDFSHLFPKPETNERIDEEEISPKDSPPLLAESGSTPNSTEKTTDKSSKTSGSSSAKDRGSSSSKKSSSSSEKDKQSSSKDRSSSSHSHHKSKSRHKERDQSSSRDKDKDKYYSEKDKDKHGDRDKSRKDSSSSNKHSSSKSSESTKHSRHSSSHSSSRRHSSDSRVKESGRNHSEKSKNSDGKTSSVRNRDKDSKNGSSSHRESSRSHSSSGKEHDKHKSSSSSSRKTSSSRTDTEQKSSRTKSSREDKDRNESHKSSRGSSRNEKSNGDDGKGTTSQPYGFKPPSPVTDSMCSIQDQRSPDVNEAGLMASHIPMFSSKMSISDHEETALDKWYSSGNENVVAESESQDSDASVPFAGDKRKSHQNDVQENSTDLPERVGDVSPTSGGSEQDENSSSFPFSPSHMPRTPPEPDSTKEDSQSSLQIAESSGDYVGNNVSNSERMKSRADLANSLRALTVTENFISKRKYLSKFIDPFFDGDVPVSPVVASKLSSSQITLSVDRRLIPDTVLDILNEKGANVCYESCD